MRIDESSIFNPTIHHQLYPFRQRCDGLLCEHWERRLPVCERMASQIFEILPSIPILHTAPFRLFVE